MTPRDHATNASRDDGGAIEDSSYLEGLANALRVRSLVVGVGGAGNNTVSRLHELGCEDLDTLALNTDAQDLYHAAANHKVLLGKRLVGGRGSGNDPGRGRLAAEEDVERIGDLLERDVVFLTCGLGGGTGTGATPVVAREAKRRGALVVAACTLPFRAEGYVKKMRAYLGLRELAKWADAVIPVPNESLLNLLHRPGLSLVQGFRVMDEILIRTIRGIAGVAAPCQLVNVDVGDLVALLSRRSELGKFGANAGFVGLGHFRADDPPEEIESKTARAYHNPLAQVNPGSVRGCLASVRVGLKASLRTVSRVVGAVADQLPPGASFKWGVKVDPTMGGRASVTIVGAGASNPHLELARALVKASTRRFSKYAEFAL
ncbi:MAG: cell division protein FtsZ [Promethearchaeota archaeon]